MREILLGALLFLGCSGSSDTGDTGDTNDTGNTAPSSAVPDFVGLSFLLESTDGFDPLTGVDIRLSFSERTESTLGFRLHPGCNSLDGEFTLDDENRMLVSLLGMTEMACETALMDQDNWFLAFMQANPVLSYEAPRLTLTDTEATLVFLDTEVATPDQDLTGILWTIDTFIDGDAMMAFNLTSPPTILFDEDGTLSFSDSCNSGMASYSASENNLSLSSFSITDLACEDETIIEASSHFHAVMSEGDTFFEIDASRITLMRESLGLSGTGE